MISWRPCMAVSNLKQGTTQVEIPISKALQLKRSSGRGDHVSNQAWLLQLKHDTKLSKHWWFLKPRLPLSSTMQHCWKYWATLQHGSWGCSGHIEIQHVQKNIFNSQDIFFKRFRPRIPKSMITCIPQFHEVSTHQLELDRVVFINTTTP